MYYSDIKMLIFAKFPTKVLQYYIYNTRGIYNEKKFSNIQSMLDIKLLLQSPQSSKPHMPKELFCTHLKVYTIQKYKLYCK